MNDDHTSVDSNPSPAVRLGAGACVHYGRPPHMNADTDETLSDADFGRAFLSAAVTPERVVAAAKRVAGDSIELGPIRGGPAGAASVKAKGVVGDPVATQLSDDPLVYRLRIPLHIRFAVKVGTLGRFEADGQVDIRVGARAVAPLALVIDLQPVTDRDVTLEVMAKDVPARFMKRAADIRREVVHHVVDYVNQMLTRPEVATFTRMDLVGLIEQGWTQL